MFFSFESVILGSFTVFNVLRIYGYSEQIKALWNVENCSTHDCLRWVLAFLANATTTLCFAMQTNNFFDITVFLSFINAIIPAIIAWQIMFKTAKYGKLSLNEENEELVNEC